MKSFIIIGNNVTQKVNVKSGLYTIGMTVKTHLNTHTVGFRTKSGWIDVVLDARTNGIRKTSTTFELKEEWIDGSVKEIEFAKELAQVIFQSTQSIAEHSLSLELYKRGKIEDTQENRDIILSYTQKHFTAFAQVAVNKLLIEG